MIYWPSILLVVKSGQAFNLDLQRTSWGFVGVSNKPPASTPLFQPPGQWDSKAVERLFTRTDLQDLDFVICKKDVN